jgi:hypothetical protein
VLQHLTHLATDPTINLAFNPFDGVSPSFGPFNTLLKSKIGMFLALVWAICLCITAYNLLVGLTKLGNAKQGGYGDSLQEAKNDSLKAAAATVALVAAPVIYGVLIAG